MYIRHTRSLIELRDSFEGGEKTILQSNNMVALRVIYFHLDPSKVWYGTIDITQKRRPHSNDDFAESLYLQFPPKF